MNTKLANFLAVAYKIPHEILSEIYLDSETIDERNDIIFQLCFDIFLKYSKEIEEYDDFDALFDEHYIEFYNEAAILRFEPDSKEYAEFLLNGFDLYHEEGYSTTDIVNMCIDYFLFNFKNIPESVLDKPKKRKELLNKHFEEFNAYAVYLNHIEEDA